MASLKLKYTAALVGSFIIGGIISVAALHAFTPDAPAAATTAKPERKVLFWYDPMKPDVKFDKPGKSPFMDMDLVPKYADEQQNAGADGSGIRIDPVQVQNLGLTTEKVTRGYLNYAQTVPANVSYNEYQYDIVQARADGFIEKVYPLTIGDKIKKGSPLVEVTIPAWVEAQSEYLLLSDTGGSENQLAGVLERLRLAGMPEEYIQRLRASRNIQTRFIIKAPIDGVITAFGLRTGMNISKDEVVAQIQGMSPVWVTAAVPESTAYLLKSAAQFAVSVPAYPDKTFHIEGWRTLPSVDAATRTVQVRLQVSNPEELLKPGMNAYIKFSAGGPSTLLIPSQAVIDTGNEQRVITVAADGSFVPKIIKIVHESGQQTGIASGLSEGESVVVNGLYLIDSEANISGALERMRQRNAAPKGDKADMSSHPMADTAQTSTHAGH
ncbi:metal RND transporter [Salmonella enterica subsp. enterica serovar Choleraesuis]|nr:metal RND transporter [Salmonella enterica subsp. enterica serovar Choleraesuis]